MEDYFLNGFFLKKPSLKHNGRGNVILISKDYSKSYDEFGIDFDKMPYHYHKDWKNSVIREFKHISFDELCDEIILIISLFSKMECTEMVNFYNTVLEKLSSGIDGLLRYAQEINNP